MDTPASLTPSATPSPARRWLTSILELLIIANALFFYTNFQRDANVPAYQEHDPDGYFWMARQIADGAPLTIKENNPYQWQTHMWVETGNGQITPKYPPGYPLLLAVFMRLFGEGNAFFASTTMGALTLVGAYWLFRQWLGITLAALALTTLLFSPMFLGYCAYPLTHGLDICLVTGSMAFLWHGIRNQRAASFVASAFLLGLTVPVRPVNLVLAAILPTALWRSNKKISTRLALLLAYAPGPLLWAAYNWRIFGSPFRSGYDLSGEQMAFSLPAMLAHLPSFIAGFNQEALPIIFPLGILGLAVWGTLRERILRGLWFLPLLGLYCSYYWPYCGMASLRFLFVAFPMLVGCAFGLVQHLTPGRRQLRIALAMLLCAMSLSVSSPRALSLGRNIRGYDGARSLATCVRECDVHLQDDAVIFGVPPAFCYLGTHRHYDFYDLDSFHPHHIEADTDPREPRMQTSRHDRLVTLYANGNEDDFEHAMEAVFRKSLDDKRQVALLLPADFRKQFSAKLSADFSLAELTTWRDAPLAHPDGHKGRKWGLYEITCPTNNH